MPPNRNHSIPIFNFVPSLLLISYLCLGFIPNWMAVDKIAPQWLALSGLNLLTALYILYRRNAYLKAIRTTLGTWMSWLYIGFILWAAASCFYAINATEAVVNVTRQTNVLLMYVHMGILLYPFRSKVLFLSWVIVGILGIEIYAVLEQAYTMVQTRGLIVPVELKGVTANRNITAFSLAIKIPFVLFLIYQVKKQSLRWVLSALVFATLFGLSMIESRASFLAAGFILVAFTGMNIFLFLNERKKRQHLWRIGYYLIPLVLAIFFNKTLIAGKGADALSRAATISANNTADYSIQSRLRYYADVLTHFKTNPIFGVGLGNWKLKSIYYDREDLVGYVVPYHAHSDFIQLGAELGIVGFLLYLGIFVAAVLFAVRSLKSTQLSAQEKVFVFLLLTALGVYSIDANLNFPIARPQVLVVWCAFMALFNFYYKTSRGPNTDTSGKKRWGIIFLFIGVLALIPCIYISNKVYQSHKGQMVLLNDFNQNKYNLRLDEIDGVVPDIPNITVTTIPMQSIKARYYIHYKKYDKALELLREGTAANPFLAYSEYMKSHIFSTLGQTDSALVNAKKAFTILPNTPHASYYITLLAQQQDREGLEAAFPTLVRHDDLVSWKNYLISAAQITPPGDSVLVSRAQKAAARFPDDVHFKQLHRSIATGNAKINQALAYSNLGQGQFSQGQYTLSATNFEKAAVLDPFEFSHYENAATAHFMAGEMEKALHFAEVVIGEMNPGNGKSEYLKGLILINQGEKDAACPWLETADKMGFPQAADSLKQHCTTS